MKPTFGFETKMEKLHLSWNVATLILFHQISKHIYVSGLNNNENFI